MKIKDPELNHQMQSFKYHRSEIIKLAKKLGLGVRIGLHIKKEDGSILIDDEKRFHW